MGTVWRHLDRPELGFLNSLSRTILGAELSAPDVLTSVRGGPGILMASDYSRGRTNGPFECMSFLLVDPRSLSAWDHARQDVRRKWLADGRRMAYKSLGDRRRAQALVPFLSIADHLAGVLVTVAMDSGMSVDSSELEASLHACGADFSAWNRSALVRMAAIGKLGVLLVSGFSAEGQDLVWITDEDEISANDTRITEATALVGHYINHLSPVNLRHIRFGSSRIDDETRFLEDLVAISDLSAGAMASIMNEELRLDRPPNIGLKYPLGDALAEKTRLIAGWLATPLGTLSKLALYVSATPGGYRVGVVTLDGQPPDPRIVIAGG